MFLEKKIHFTKRNLKVISIAKKLGKDPKSIAHLLNTSSKKVEGIINEKFNTDDFHDDSLENFNSHKIHLHNQQRIS